MKSQADFEKGVKRSLVHMEAKLSYLCEGVKGLNEAFSDFHDQITDYMNSHQNNTLNMRNAFPELKRR